MKQDINYWISVYTHCGNNHDINEDSFSINGKSKPISKECIGINGSLSSDSVMLAVFDGMGGEQMGEEASTIAAAMSKDLYKKMAEAEPDYYRDIVNEYVNNVNKTICEMLHNTSSSRGGTTIAMVFIKDNVVYPFSLGDSRIYLLANDELKQISEDNTLAMRKYKANIYTLEEAMESPDSHKLTLFLGVDVDGNGLSAQWYQPFILPKRGKLLLCTDGLYDMCNNEEIKEVLQKDSKDLTSILIRKALKNGGIDNVTCITVNMY